MAKKLREIFLIEMNCNGNYVYSVSSNLQELEAEIFSTNGWEGIVSDLESAREICYNLARKFAEEKSSRFNCNLNDFASQ